jgi:hypothetical protein
MSTDFDFRALCAELLPPLVEYDASDPYHEHRDLIARALAALAKSQPPATAPLPTGYIDPEHRGEDLKLLQAFYQAGQSGGGTADESYLRGIRAALAIDRAALAHQGRVTVPGAQRDAVIADVTEALGNAYDCLRVWEAWGVGTMGEDDFKLIAENGERVVEIADAAIEAMRLAAPPAAGPWVDGIPCDFTRTLLRPAYKPGDGGADGAQLVNLAWWHPIAGSNSLQIVVDNARAILARRRWIEGGCRRIEGGWQRIEGGSIQ